MSRFSRKSKEADFAVELALEQNASRKWEMLNEQAMRLGASSLTIGSSRPTEDKPDFFVSSFSNNQFWTNYLDQKWHDIDPSAQNALASIPKTLWNLPNPKRFRTHTKLDDFAGNVSAHGTQALLCYTDASDGGRVVSGFTVTVDKPLADIERAHFHSFQELAYIYFAMSINIMSLNKAHSLLRISERELEVLRALVAGRVIKQIAYDLGISYRMISKHLTAVKSKLGAPTNESAVAIALEIGLI
jgi:DNA-binding CsgD family transcriptional regulator